jgi:hypothetical protein
MPGRTLLSRWKRVFRVFNASQERHEAMCVLDLQSLRRQGLESQLSTELWARPARVELATSWSRVPSLLTRRV